MIKNTSGSPLSWPQSRYGFVAFNFLSLLFAWFVLRIVFLLMFKSAAFSSGEAWRVLLVGLQRDLLGGLIMLTPLLLWMFLFPERWVLTRWYRYLFLTGTFLFWFFAVFLLFVEFFFFDEFKSRYNTVAVDYLR